MATGDIYSSTAGILGWDISTTDGGYIGVWAADKPIINPKTNREEPMEALFNVIVVSKDREILLNELVVSEGEVEAKFDVDIHSVLKEKGLRPKDVTVICRDLGGVKVRREVQKVKLVDKEE